MVSVLASSVVDRGFEPRSGQIKDYTIGMCCFPLSIQLEGVRAKIDWLGLICPRERRVYMRTVVSVSYM
jgi:hypothetical protein